MSIKGANRCLYISDFRTFVEADPYSILGRIHDAFHGQVLTTTDEAWLGEILLLQSVLLPWKDEEAEIIFEYNIPRLGKRIDVVLLLRGMIFCLEFKIGQKDTLQSDVEQVMDYALDLKNFHRYSHDRIIVPILIPTKHASSSSIFTPSVYSDSIFNPLAAELYKDVVSHGYPIVLTRSMDKAREWLRQQARGTQQTGILISKVSARFKPLAVHVLPQSEDNAVHWFLEDKTDVRSSNYLEEAATEIQVQGLEVDFACVLWDADMRYDNNKWTFWKFNGRTQWTPEKNIETQKYMLNAYRVLLTRARQGMVICVPEGNGRKTPEGFPEDSTRLPVYYDYTYKYFKDLGINEI